MNLHNTHWLTGMIIGFATLTAPNFSPAQGNMPPVPSLTVPAAVPIADIFGPRPPLAAQGTNPATSTTPSAAPPGRPVKNGFVPPDPVSFRIRMELGDVEQARAWLDAGLDPDYLGDHLGSGLHIAAWNGNIPLMALFLSRGAHIDLPNNNNEQPLQMAALQGKTEAVEWLLAQGAPINIDARGGAWTPLHYAAFSGQQQLITELLDKGANIDAQAPNGTTPLMAAIYGGKREVAESLVRQGARRDLKNDWGDGALEWAMKYNQTDLARMIASPEAFAEAASKPRASWDSRRSEPAPPELLRLLAEREQLIAKGISPRRIDQNIAALRARYAQQSRAEAQLMTLDSLEIRPTETQQRNGHDLSQFRRASPRRASPATSANRSAR